MSYDKVQVGNRIRGSRLEKGWTQERLAAEAEISVQQLRALEKGQRNLGVDHLGRLSDAMGVSSDFLLKGCSENSTLVCKMLDDLKKKKKNCSHRSKSQKNERFCRKNSIFQRFTAMKVLAIISPWRKFQLRKRENCLKCIKG